MLSCETSRRGARHTPAAESVWFLVRGSVARLSPTFRPNARAGGDHARVLTRGVKLSSVAGSRAGCLFHCRRCWKIKKNLDETLAYFGISPRCPEVHFVCAKGTAGAGFGPFWEWGTLVARLPLKTAVPQERISSLSRM